MREAGVFMDSATGNLVTPADPPDSSAPPMKPIARFRSLVRLPRAGDGTARSAMGIPSPAPITTASRIRLRKTKLPFSHMLIRSFRKASMGLGEFCPLKNELRVRKGSKVYRFICGDSELRFAAPGQEEVVIHIAPDATVPELRKGIASLIGPK